SEWVIACKGGKAAGSNFPEHAGILAQVVLMGNVALRPALKSKLLSTKLLFDAKEFKFTNMPEANQYLTKEYRQGWEL
ncbi:MAG: gfo/Idh/MocA family oxidoreductase, partial [Planctomycetes bacterium]|nr:gfo/Idh/MocA family oxidoreductase [Planctomycetota bacterium]